MQASYLITYREDATEHRRRNLESVLAWLSTLPIRVELQVIVVEQSQTPSLHREADELFRDVTLVHTFNPGEFNKSWGLNIAARYATTPWLFFADADMMLPNGLDETLDMLARGVEVVKPYSRLIDLNENETLALDDGELPSALGEPDAGTQARAQDGEYVVLAGGIFAIQSKTFARMGGFDERFLGWAAKTMP